jgi:hypothetical protein
MAAKTSLSAALQKRRADIRTMWSQQLIAAIGGSAEGRISTEELNQQMEQFLQVFEPASCGVCRRSSEIHDSRHK